MLDRAPIYASIPAEDIDRARRWYEDKLGLTPIQDISPNGLVYRSGGVRFVVYPTPYAGTGKHTVAGWNVTDIDAAVRELRDKGVVFKDYDGTDGPRTVDGIARADGGAAAWFTDSEDNILNLSQVD
jgi:catechol 2,3-dioxygenase-like lactoylglutathione lyase family enzyme